MSGSSLAGDLVVGYHIVRADVVRRYRRICGKRRLMSLAVLIGLLNLPIVIFVSQWLHGVGQQSQSGLSFPAVAAARNLLLPWMGLLAVFSALSAAQELGDDTGRSLLMSTVPDRALLVGEVGIESLGLVVMYVLPVGIFGTAFALGAETPLAVLNFFVVGLPPVLFAFLLGQALAYGFWLGLLALPLSVGVRQVVGSLTAVVMMLVSFAIGGLVGSGAAAGSLRAAIPTGPPPTPVGWYADLLFLASPLSTSVGIESVLAAAVLLGAIPLTMTAIVRLAPRFWYAVPNSPDTAEAGDAAAASEVSGPASETVGRRGRLTGMQTARLAAGYVRRVRRRPDRLTHLLYYLVLASFVGLPGLLPGGETSIAVTGFALLLFGIWLAGAAVCLNPLGDEGSMLSTVLLSETPAKRFIDARLLTGVVAGLPVALAGLAVMMNVTRPPALTLGLTVLLTVLVVFASAGAALGIGAAVPRFGTARLFRGVEAVAPSLTGALTHGGLMLVLALVTTNLAPLAVGADWLGPRWSRGLVVVAFGLLLVGLADGGRRYATMRLDRYGRDGGAASPALAGYTVVGLALVSLVVAQVVTIATFSVGIGLQASPARQLGLLFVLQYGGFLAVALGFLYTTERGLSYLDVSLPAARALGYVVGGLAVALGIWLASSTVAAELGLPAADQSVVESAAVNPTLLLVLVPLVVFVNAPVEELLYRNVVQKYLTESVGSKTAILATSALFASVHVPAYFDPDPFALAVPLVLLFVLSCVWGLVYDRTGNLVVATACHGLYNATLLVVAYVAVAG